jgi:hypothetical protein
MITRRKIPFSNTSVNPYKTKGQIDELLNSFGVTKTAWQIDLDESIIELNFEAESILGDEKRTFFFKIRPSLFESEHRTYNAKLGKSEKVIAPNLAASMRWLRAYVKAKLEAVAYGMITVEREFLSQVVVSNQRGEAVTVGDAIEPALRSGMLALEEKIS